MNDSLLIRGQAMCWLHVTCGTTNMQNIYHMLLFLSNVEIICFARLSATAGTNSSLLVIPKIMVCVEGGRLRLTQCQIQQGSSPRWVGAYGSRWPSSHVGAARRRRWAVACASRSPLQAPCDPPLETTGPHLRRPVLTKMPRRRAGHCLF